MHTAKALEALSTSITLFALPGENIKHSPIATCALALAVMAQASACRLFACEGRKDGNGGRERLYAEGRDRVRLGLGALRAGVRVWGLARRSVGEVVGVARELLEGEGNSSGNGNCGRETERSLKSKDGAAVRCNSVECRDSEMAMGSSEDAIVVAEGMTV